jgi:hypothetical protein
MPTEMPTLQTSFPETGVYNITASYGGNGTDAPSVIEHADGDGGHTRNHSIGDSCKFEHSAGKFGAIGHHDYADRRVHRDH